MSPVPHRQYVFSIPKILRKFFFYDHKLLGKLSQCAVKSLAKFFKIMLGKKTGIPGIAAAIQTFGDYAGGILIFTPWSLTVCSWKAAISL